MARKCIHTSSRIALTNFTQLVVVPGELPWPLTSIATDLNPCLDTLNANGANCAARPDQPCTNITTGPEPQLQATFSPARPYEMLALLDQEDTLGAELLISAIDGARVWVNGVRME